MAQSASPNSGEAVSSLRAWALGTAITGALDISYAALVTVMNGGIATNMLRGVAAGPLGDRALQWGTPGAFAGLAVHFTLMSIMVAVWLRIRRIPFVAAMSPWLSGALYGLAIYLVMFGVVLPLRFGSPFPPAKLLSLATSLFAHVVVVGMSMAWVTWWAMRPRQTASA